jgi:hypothetical protein
MAEEDRTPDSGKRAARRRKLKTFGHIFMLLLGCLYLWIFIRIVMTGYLTWIGITAGTVFITPCVVVSAVGLAGKKALEKRLNQIWNGMLIAAVVIIVATLLWSERPGQWRPFSFDTEIAALEARRAVPDEENAALRYDVALAALDANDRPDFFFAGGGLRDELAGTPWTEQAYPEASAWLDSHAPLVAELRQIGRMEHCRWPLYANSECDWTVPYKKLGYAWQLVLAAGNRHLGEGRQDEALESYFCLLRHADHLRQQTCRLDLQMSIASERTALPMIRHVLMRGELSSQEIQRIARRLPPATDTWNRDVTRMLEFDEYRFAQFLAPVYEINEHGKTRFAAYFALLSEDKQAPRKSTYMGRVWRLYCYMNMPLAPQGIWPMAGQESAQAARLLESGPMLRIPRDQRYPEASFADFLTLLAGSPARWLAREACFDTFMYPLFGESYATHLTQRRGTWLVVGLRRYHDEHATWPQTLDALAPHVPVEAFEDPTSGDSFVYTHDADTFKLYSKGLNRIDEHGRKGRNRALERYEDDIAIWPPYVTEPKPMTEAETQEARDEMMKQLAEIYGQRHVKDMLSEPNENQDAKNRTKPKSQ